MVYKDAFHNSLTELDALVDTNISTLKKDGLELVSRNGDTTSSCASHLKNLMQVGGMAYLYSTGT